MTLTLLPLFAALTGSSTSRESAVAARSKASCAHALSSHSSNPATGAQKSFEIDDEHKTRCFVDKRMGQDVDISSLGEQFKGYVVRIGGANDKQGFPAKREWGLLRREKRRARPGAVGV